MRNHGFVAMGETAEEAWLLTYYTVLAAETQVRFYILKKTFDFQVKAMVGGLDNLIMPSEKAIQQAYEVAQKGGSLWRAFEMSFLANNHDNRVWKSYRYGEFEWEAWMRELDARVI